MGKRTIDLILADGRLRTAFKRVKARGGTAGSDGIDAIVFSRNLNRELKRLATDVQTGRYRPGRLKSVVIPKPCSGVRTLRIPCLRDRVLQGAANSVLIEQLDRKMHPGSFGYRPRRSVDLALNTLLRCRGWAFDADIQSFFDEVAHGPLITLVEQEISCPMTCALLRTWMKGFGRRGLAQGAPISPLLANLALGPLDDAMSHHGRIIRYADDFVVMCCDRATARAAQSEASHVLRRAGLKLHPKKTQIIAPETPFVFLGQTCILEKSGGKNRNLQRKKKKIVAKHRPDVPRRRFQWVVQIGWNRIRDWTLK